MPSASVIERPEILPSQVASPVEESTIPPETEQFVFDLAVSLINGTSHGKLPDLIVMSEFTRRLRTQTMNTSAVSKMFVDEASDLLARRDLGLSLRMGQNEIPLLPHNQLLLEAKRADYATKIGMLLQEVV